MDNNTTTQSEEVELQTKQVPWETKPCLETNSLSKDQQQQQQQQQHQEQEKNDETSSSKPIQIIRKTHHLDYINCNELTNDNPLHKNDIKGSSLKQSKNEQNGNGAIKKTENPTQRLRFQSLPDEEILPKTTDRKFQSQDYGSRRHSTSRRFKRQSCTSDASSSLRRVSSRRRRFSRRYSSAFVASEDLEEIQIPRSASKRSCIQFFPMRPHALFIGFIVVVSSFIGIISTAALLFQILFNSKWFQHIIYPQKSVICHQNNQTLNHDFNSTDLLNDCNNEFNGEKIIVTKKQAKEQFEKQIYIVFLAIFLFISMAFLYSGVLLCKGIWYNRRRYLIPWLLLTGMAVLFFIMSSLYVFLATNGWIRLLTLVPMFLGLIFFYYWMLVNELLDEMHEEKKADAAYETELGLSEGFGGMTTTAGGIITSAFPSEVCSNGKSKPNPI